MGERICYVITGVRHDGTLVVLRRGNGPVPEWRTAFRAWWWLRTYHQIRVDVGPMPKEER